MTISDAMAPGLAAEEEGFLTATDLQLEQGENVVTTPASKTMMRVGLAALLAAALLGAVAFVAAQRRGPPEPAFSDAEPEPSQLYVVECQGGCFPEPQSNSVGWCESDCPAGSTYYANIDDCHCGRGYLHGL